MTIKTILLTLGTALLGLQFFPIDQNRPHQEASLELQEVQNPPDEVIALLKNACYDCHSNQTRWPWYAGLQPLGWWLQGHVRQGRAELNFSEFGRLSPAERLEVLDHCANLLEKGRMPLENYLPLHPEARLEAAQQRRLVDWLRHPATAEAPERITCRDSCDSPDASVDCCFAGRPARLDATMIIAGVQEPGERLMIRGRVLQADGKTPQAEALLYAYHTDASGHYRQKGDETGIQRWHGALHGWCRTDAEGRYEIRTIRPAPYPGNQIPAHIHAALWLPGQAHAFFLNDFVFADDARIDGRYRDKEQCGRGGSGVVVVKKDGEGVWWGQRDIVVAGGK